VGSHLIKRLDDVVLFDRVDNHDASDLDQLATAMAGCEQVFHLASNADIAKAATDPTVDFWQGTFLTQNVVEAARLCGVKRIMYASGSGVYGDRDDWVHENTPLRPNSPYGASKAAGEALVSAYCQMFGMQGRIFRFANIVGPRQTHGVGYDFVRKLKADPSVLDILGDGQQSKSYIHVDDALDAVMLAMDFDHPVTFHNVATEDFLTVWEIADLACEVMGVTPAYRFTGGRGGWAGDVPVVRLESSAIRALGWQNRYSSRQAMREALKAMAGNPVTTSYGRGDDLA
jgi:UDP-glucose 4-epimerase